jgi:hypothetical protein
VNNISTTNITNVYNKTVINNVTVNRVSYNGGNGGVRAQPTPAEEAATRERHIAVTPAQSQHDQTARSTPELRASRNQGHPPIAATPRPATFSGPGVVPAKGGTMSVVQPRGAQSETRTPQPAPQRAQEYRPPVEQQRPPVQQQYRPPVEQQRPQVEQRRPPEQAQPPKQSAPPREAPRPSEHPPEH